MTESTREGYPARGNTPDKTARATPRRLCARLRRMTDQLRRHYELASDAAMRRPVDEWLCDNYYVLEKESKQAMRDIRHMGRASRAGELGELYALLAGEFCGKKPPLTDETLTEILRLQNAKKPMSELQFAFVPAAMKAILIEIAHQAVAASADAESMAYAITGFGKLSSVDMQEIVQRCSDVEKILLQDPAGIYPAMTDDSRSYYRHLVARVARLRRSGEHEVAQALLELARAENRHIGELLIHDPLLWQARRRRGGFFLALGAALPLALALLAGFWSGSLVVSLLCFLPLWEILRVPLQQIALAGVDVDFIPRMELSKLPEKPATVVLVSTLLPKASEAPALATRLEQLYFSNPDPDLYYCILADLGEWDYPTDEKDDSQIEAARKVIESLNRRYQPRFMLFLRSRVYNKTQRRFSGWERKRGAITEFVRFLDNRDTSLHTFVGERAALARVRYLIALDSDTNLLFEGAKTLISAAVHPLNKPVAGAGGAVTRGYGIFMPKISTDLHSAKATAFSRVMSGCGGVTAYESRDKDFYQDLFGESIFSGKGLICVEAFREALDQRFPEGRVLSHDILEGAYLRCAFLSDVEMTDNAPPSMASWLSRLHRWLRGDWQNIVFLGRRYRAEGRVYENPISGLNRYKLFDNLRRSLTPVAVLLCCLAALAAPPRHAALLAAAGILAVMFPSLWAAMWSLAGSGFFTLSRKFFTRTLPHFFELIGQAFLLLIMLPSQAFLTADAALRSLWRTFISRRRLLEWTTAAQGDRQSRTFFGSLRRFWPAELFGLLYLAAGLPANLWALGALFALVLPIAYWSAKATPQGGGRLSAADRDTLVSYNAAMWRYYEEHANRQNNWLPPDNLQQSPVRRVAARTSPTNIGMHMLSMLAARDFNFIDNDGLLRRLDRTLSTVERLSKWHGNLYNWYDTETLDTLKPAFVSTVDSGNFVCCLVALKEGLRELLPETREFAGLIRRMETMIDSTDLTVFYNRRKHLFSIGWDAAAESLVNSHYDFLMSEARLTSYFAIARKAVPKKHWGVMARAMSRWGSYAGPVSWTGTMFEYYMPHLLLPVYDGSLLGEALAYCLFCQRRRARAAGAASGVPVPWGISESAFYAFDNNLNYQYKAHGVQKLGVKRGLDRDLVISPYSTFLTLPWSPNTAMRNLHELRERGVYGHYGFYEAVDFTADRVGTGGLAVTRSYMAHHIGMSMVASVNAVFSMRMQRRFMADHHMRSAREFLQEKIAKSAVVYKALNRADIRVQEKQERPRVREEKRDIDPTAPQCLLLTNGELTDLLSDTGAGHLKFGEVDLTRRDSDLLRRAQGVFTLVRMDGVTLPTTKAPFYDPDALYRLEQQEQCVTFFSEKKGVEVGVRCLIHPTISCQQRQIVVKNRTGVKQVAEVLCYLEPVLAPYGDYSAHPAYSKLFVTSRYDKQSRTLTFTRRNRDSTTDLFLTVGFLQDIDFVFETRREALLSSPSGMEELLRFPDKPFSNMDGGVPDACAALRFDLLLNPGGQQQATLLLSAARSAAEGAQNIIAMRARGSLEPKHAAKSHLLGDSLEARLGARALGQLFFTTADSSMNLAEKRRNNLGQSALWCTGISGDMPIALLELTPGGDLTACEGYVRLHTALRRLGIPFDLVALCADPDQQAEFRLFVERHSVATIIGARGGIFPLLRDELASETLTLLRAVARHIAAGGNFRAAAPPPPPPRLSQYRPVRFRPVAPYPMPRDPELSVEGGCFETEPNGDGRFYADRVTPLPWSHILANPAFGTLVSDTSLGFTWAVNSRENKLTPWYNDIATDNTGELCILNDGDDWYNLTRGARASFSHKDACYQGLTPVVATELRVTVGETGCVKCVELTLHNREERERELECAYYIEPVLGVNRDTARHIAPEEQGGCLLLHNSYNTAVRCYAALAGKVLNGAAGPARFTVDRAAFLSGDWQSPDIGPSGDPCAAVVLPVRLPAGGEARLRFLLGFGGTAESAIRAVTEKPAPRPQEKVENRFAITTPDPCLNQFINHFAPHQILAGRVYGRCAFYQCGGAYGFRDQLQDVMAILLLRPAVAKRQILRCCAVQFEEGDVLHWWHCLPKNAGGLRGVRTRFSDDLLWLPLAVADYVEKSGDAGILRLPVGYLRAPELPDGEMERYITPERSPLREDVFAHCARAIERGYRLDERGLPLIGAGDWNDGFSAVGREGKGSSVWLALFIAVVLTRFAKVCAARGEAGLEREYLARADGLRQAVDKHCWDGGWYLRAFFDDGTPMGSHTGEECRIDLLPQTFAVFAGMPEKSRVSAALTAALDHLVDYKLRLVKLFDPPFQHARQQPGYVKAYPSGLRENGGQYTHSAVWFAMALLREGRAEEGWRILEMLNPVNRATYPALLQQYKLEPYYMAADIYTNPSASGRGGWSLYTGAASWYYRAVLETLLGLRLHRNELTFAPRLPESWPEVTMRAVIRGTELDIRIARAEPPGLRCDGVPMQAAPLDGGKHELVIGYPPNCPETP